MNKLRRRLRRLDRRFWLALPLLLLLSYGAFGQYAAYRAGVLPLSEPAKITAAAGFDDERPEGSVIVAVSGLARRRGYFVMPPEAGLRDLLEFVGLQAASDVAAWDLAHRPQQGDRYYIADSGESGESGEPWLFNVGDLPEEDAGLPRLDLNTATLEELQELPGIGPSRAQAILAYRVEHQGFRYVQELLGVKGIGEKIYLQLKDRVSV